MSDYGEVICQRQQDGTVTVTRADPLIGVSSSFLAHRFHTARIVDGLLVMDTAGEYRYRPVRFAEDGRIVVCERIGTEDP